MYTHVTRYTMSHGAAVEGWGDAMVERNSVRNVCEVCALHIMCVCIQIRQGQRGTAHGVAAEGLRDAMVERTSVRNVCEVCALSATKRPSTWPATSLTTSSTRASFSLITGRSHLYNFSKVSSMQVFGFKFEFYIVITEASQLLRMFTLLYIERAPCRCIHTNTCAGK